MGRAVRWAVAVVAAVAVFVLCAWLVRVVPFEWLPADDGDRWGVALGFAGAVAAAVGGAVNWWAGQGDTSSPGRRVRQTVRAGGRARVYQAGRDLRSGDGGAAAGGGTAGDVVQRARVSGDARAFQAGRDQDVRRSGGR
ncbi:hypothetical protein HZZ00_37095 [Streptomyces sp. NEAU-sy36]|uniref:hypothetical protein n=1 Tax=unclassified Streptomyces TaxID=2593676 RepID=UPI0015D5AAF1|nr:MULTISPECIES: hypothetical protein [unclassified Streptomyces]QLI99535.1 hypothetical protein HZZ00_00110 [Streptomyces sp. NEAU-sy36]QLJ06076.1 hypothetical protein HZZ00_37095 [Streptomyces sp. NEAU-sy36]